MRVGIIEVSEPNHYSAVNGLIKTYATDRDNQITVYTLPSIQLALQENGLPQNTQVVTLAHRKLLDQLLKSIEAVEFDRIHICTIFDNYAEFSQFKPHVKEVFFHVHQCEEWYNDTAKRAIKNLVLNLKYKDQNRKYHRMIARALVDFLVFRPQRRQIVANLSENYQFTLIVHSDQQRETLVRYGCKHRAIVFPFAIYEGMDDTAVRGQRLRICIPGVITQARRDYLGLFKHLQENADRLHDRICLHLLGYVTDREKAEMDVAIADLIDVGYQVLYHDTFVYGQEFDAAMASCDVLLNNQVVSKNTTEVYGQTKESGMIFNMLRAAKPGLLPSQYNVAPEFHPSTLFFDDYGQLIEIITRLLDDRQALVDLKAAAKALSVDYLPQQLYPRLNPVSQLGHRNPVPQA
jgi:hypothetical protein